MMNIDNKKTIYFDDAPDTDPYKADDAENDTEYYLRSNYRYKTLVGQNITVPAGFRTDEVSAPQATWAIVGMPPDGYYRAAGVVHDYLYSLNGKVPGIATVLSRKQCDGVLLEILTRLKTPWWKRRVAYLAVRLFGGGHWKS